MPLTENLANRKWLLSRLRAEIVGPDPAGGVVESTDAADTPISWEDMRRPRVQPNGEEIIWQDPPTKRYGAGILYPQQVDEGRERKNESEDLTLQGNGEGAPDPEVDEKLETRAAKRAARTRVAMDDSEDYEIGLANSFRPSVIGVSFVADLGAEERGFEVDLVCVVRHGRTELVEMAPGVYRKVMVRVGNPADPASASERPQWLRTPVRKGDGSFYSVSFSAAELLKGGRPLRRSVAADDSGLQIIAYSRSWRGNDNSKWRLVTVSLVNRKLAESEAVDGDCLFQSGIRIRGVGGGACICPYPEPAADKADADDPMTDERISSLLYRQSQTFAIGHGCSADWGEVQGERVGAVWSDVMPSFETPSTSADLTVEDATGQPKGLRISMWKLAGLDPAGDGMDEVGELVDAYGRWIEALKQDRHGIPAPPAHLGQTAAGLIARCETCLVRIRDGVSFLGENSEAAGHAREAFRLANRAMLISRLRETRDVRRPRANADGTIAWEPAAQAPDLRTVHATKGYWRAFQIAFLLMTIRGICEPESNGRNSVDLIWFPTGGGKTEAYLGLTAFTIFYNRLSGRTASGADVLMRYTLRLLTAQQFQRAALLFCAMESIRWEESSLGGRPFRVGLWVGGDATPNRRADALVSLHALERDPEDENPFVLLKCPWCAAAFGPAGEEENRRRGAGRQRMPSLFGYRRWRPSPRAPNTVVYRCGDPACDFGEALLGGGRNPLPVVVIDEDLYEDPPSLVIGTVDKFALLSWRPRARRLFGIDDDGHHVGVPPTLIIQDELHLISGPLGSMVGAFETVVERLCREDGTGDVRPKIIASTATISRAKQQIRHLYARNDVFLFPPSGLEAGDSFFAREARDEHGSLMPGRLYAGVLAPAHGSSQTTLARVMATLLQSSAIMNADDSGRDPWWTLLCFFNSLRELGSAATLLVADARDYLRVILDRCGVGYASIRKLFEVSELTSRIRSDQIPKELERLERVYPGTVDASGGGAPVDACLASNIIEVGVDISRLSLMAIVGQPKTTSQYIQVSSRVGRDPEKPGLVAVLYGSSRPRDRSHYERFRSYHQRLYSQVEPTSVTPFSPPAVDRALHAMIVALVRQFGEVGGAASSPQPFPLEQESELRNLVEEALMERVRTVAPEEAQEVSAKIVQRLREWQSWQPGEYGDFFAVPEDPPLIHPAGSTEPAQWMGRSWPTMSSLRDVDATCEAEVTAYFSQIGGGSP